MLLIGFLIVVAEFLYEQAVIWYYLLQVSLVINLFF